MKLDRPRYPLLMVLEATAGAIGRRPYLAVSVALHAALLALLYYYGSYRFELRQQEAEVTSSLRATSQASMAKRVQDLQTIKQLLEKSADRADAGEPAAPPPPAESPQEMLEQARELAKAIDTLDKDIQAEELAKLIGKPVPPPKEAAPAPAPPESALAQASTPEPAPAAAPAAEPAPAGGVTPDQAAEEIAALETKARAALAKRQQQLDARENGVAVQGAGGTGNQPGAGSVGEGSAGSGVGSGSSGNGGGGASVRAEIADFIGAGDRIEQVASKQYNGWGTDFFDKGIGQIPPLDGKPMVKGQGRMLGAGGQYANRVYLNSWYIIGPFAGKHEGGLFSNPSYPPEKAVLLDAVYFGKDKRLLKWRYVNATSYPLIPPDPAEDAVYYGYTEVFMDKACDLKAWIGADDDAQVYLNDHLIWKGGNVNKQWFWTTIYDTRNSYVSDYNRNEGIRTVHFKKGVNKLFFKLSNGPTRLFFSMVLSKP